MTQFTLERGGTVLSEGILAESSNQYFTSVACDIPPFDAASLSQFLFHIPKVPVVHRYEVYKKLLKV